MDEILHAIEPFRQVIIASDLSLFPKTPKGTDLISYVGENCFRQFLRCEMLPLGVSENRNLLRRANHGLIGKKRIAWMEERLELMYTPLWAKAFARWQEEAHPDFVFQLMENHIHLELNKTKKKIDQEKAQRFLEALAGSIGFQQQEGGDLSMSPGEWKALAQVFEIDPAPLKRFFLFTLPDGSFRFRHQALLSFFLARAAFKEGLMPELTHFPGLPFARTCFLEMAWLSYRKETLESEAWYRVVGEEEKYPVSELRTPELSLIRRLYLSDYNGRDLRFLRMLDHLTALHLSDTRLDEIPPELISELPNEHVLLYLGWDAKIQKIMAVTHETADLNLPNEQSLSVIARSFQEIRPQMDLNPYLPVEDEFRERVQKGQKNILNLFDTDLPGISWEEGQKPESFVNAKGDRFRTSELHLGIPELDLFDLIEIFAFENGSHNLRLTNKHQATLLEEILKEMVNRFYRVYGEDDFHQTEFTADDASQIQDGRWRGRKWSWKNTDSYAYPVHLFMPKPGKVHLIIRGLEPLPENVSSSGFSVYLGGKSS